MKRFLFSLFATVGGLAALLSFKTETHPLAAVGPLPSVGGPVGSPASTPASSSAPAGSGASPSSSAPAVTTRSFVGGSVTTQYGIVQVKVSVRGSQIVNVAFVQLTAFDQRSAEINNAAAPILLQETMKAQNAHIDTVSGATFTSDGYLRSLQSALDAAGIH